MNEKKLNADMLRRAKNVGKRLRHAEEALGLVPQAKKDPRGKRKKRMALVRYEHPLVLCTEVFGEF